MVERDDEPSRGEIARHLARIEDQQKEILDELKHDRIEFAKTYVRQDVYLSQRDLLNATISDTRADVATVDAKIEADRNNRRGMLLWLGTLSVTMLGIIAGVIVAFVR